MASLSEERKLSSGDILSEIQAERMVYQINSSSDTRKVSNKMKRGTEEVIKSMENTRSIVYERKIAVDEMKVNLSEKKDKIKKLQQDLERARKHVESSTKKTLDLEIETNKITSAMEKIKEATQDLEEKYLEKSQNELMSFFVKITSDAEKAQSDLNAAKRIESNLSKKLQETEIDFSRLELHVTDKTNEVERMISNVNTTIDHITRSYDEITSVSKELLKSAMSTNMKFGGEEQYVEVEDSQSHQETNSSEIAI